MTFFFAWVDESETAFAPAHAREDEQVFGFNLFHQEGEFPSLEIDIKNPRVGLLNPGRFQWMWFSYDDGSSDAPIPLFFGRLVGIPQQIQGEVVRLAFLARPADYAALKAAAAALLKVPPYYDPLWVEPDARDDPDAVLEFYPALFHIDRTSLAVTISDISAGEDGTIDFGGQFFYNSLGISYSTPPARRVQVDAEVSWDQIAQGEVDFTETIKARFLAENSAKGGYIQSYTGGGLVEDWPEPGDNIGEGWEVGQSSARRSHGQPDDLITVITSNATVKIPLWSIIIEFNAAYDVSRRRVEKLNFTLEADTQAVLADAGDDEDILISVASADAGSAIDPADTDYPDGATPIRDARRRQYFTTDRGQESLEALISMARARLIARARAVNVDFDIPFDDALALSCRKNAKIDDDRIPGGTATGKIAAYSLALDGDTGEKTAKVVIACMCGNGATVSESAGTPDYVEEGYVAAGWQTYSGKTIVPIAGEVSYTDYQNIEPNDDGIDFFAMTPEANLISVDVISPRPDQAAVLGAFQYDISDAIAALNQVYTEVDLTLRPLTGGPFETIYPIAVSQLMIPKTIDLGAATA